MQTIFSQKNLVRSFLAALLITASGCSGKGGASAQQADTKTQAVSQNDSHAKHNHDEAPKTIVQTAKALTIPSGSYTMDKEHGYVTFSYLHKGLSNPQLRFNNVDAHLVLDSERPENSQVTVTINPANIDSGVAKFDAHLKSADFFNVEANPKISFTSNNFTRAGAKAGTMTGTLTMMGVSKSISFDVTLIGTGGGSKPALGVEARGALLRSDFSLGKYVPHVGDKVDIVVSAEFHKDAAHKDADHKDASKGTK